MYYAFIPLIKNLVFMAKKKLLFTGIKLIPASNHPSSFLSTRDRLQTTRNIKLQLYPLLHHILLLNHLKNTRNQELPERTQSRNPSRYLVFKITPIGSL